MPRALIASDDFTRSGADGQEISANGNWLYLRDIAWQSSAPKSWGSQVSFNASGAHYQVVRWNGAQAFDNNQYSKVRIRSYANRGSGYWIGPTVRCSADTDGAADFYAYYVYDDAAEGGARSTRLVKVLNGVETQLATASVVANNEAFVELEVEGTTLRAFINGTQTISFTDTSLSTGKPGFLGSGDGSVNVADDWEGGNITASGTNGTGSGATLTALSSMLAGTATGGSGASGTLTTKPLKNNTRTVLASETGVTLNIYNATTGALVVQKTGVTTNSSGIAIVTDPLIVSGTNYAYEPVLTGGRRRLPLATAT